MCKLLSYKGGRDYYTKKYDNQLSGKTFDFVITDEYENFFDKFNTDANYLKKQISRVSGRCILTKTGYW